MRQFILLLLLSFSFSLFSNAQSKIYFEETEPELIIDTSNGVLISTDFIPMKNENEDTIEVNWFFTLDIPAQENPDNENILEEVWWVLLCDEILCHSYPMAQSTIPPKDEYNWKFNVSASPWLNEWVLGEGKVTLTVINIADQTENASFTANLKLIASGCMDETACDYNPVANVDSGSCAFVDDACFDENGNQSLYDENCVCIKVVCNDESACNTDEDGDCLFAGSNCSDENIDEGVFDQACACVKAVCNDENACNNGEDGNCIFMDCAGECGGSAIAGSACMDENGNEGEFGEDCACIAICNNEDACNNGEAGDCLFTDCAGECGGSAEAGSSCTDVNGNESVYDDECTCIEVVGIDEFITLSKPIFPNPTNNLINLQLEDINHDVHSIKIVNLQGQDVINLNGLDKKPAYQIDLSKLTKGLYHINLLDDKGKLLYSEMIERQ